MRAINEWPRRAGAAARYAGAGVWRWWRHEEGRIWIWSYGPQIDVGVAAGLKYWKLDVHPFFGTEVADDHLCRICDALLEFRMI